MNAPVPEGDSVSLAPGDDLYRHPENTHAIMYLVAFAVFVGLSVWGLVAFGQHRDDERATALATELAIRFADAGLRSIDIDAAARVLGTDGGAACTAIDGVLRDGLRNGQLVSGAPGPGQRPVLASRELLVGSRLVVEVYCPARIPDYDALVDDLKVVDGR